MSKSQLYRRPKFQTLFLSLLMLILSVRVAARQNSELAHPRLTEVVTPKSDNSPRQEFLSELFSPSPQHFPDRQPPTDLVACLIPVEVNYYDYRKQFQTGVLVINRDLEQDVKEIFSIIAAIQFPLTSVLPVNKFDWSDDRSMAADNTSAYNFRKTPTGLSWSAHALGKAIDINPKCNPYISANAILPAGAVYRPESPCAISESTELGRTIIQAFESRGWKWGGRFHGLKDYQHFEKLDKNAKQRPFCGSREPDPPARSAHRI